MNKTIISLAATLAVCVAVAADKPHTAQEFNSMSPEERKELFEKRTGGLVRREAEGPNVVVVDGRKTPGKVLRYFEKENIESHGSKPGLPVKTYAEEIEEAVPIAKALKVLNKERAAIAIVIVHGGDGMPGLTVCPEDRVAAVNADKYDNKDFLLLKEVWRAIGFIGGVGYSKYSADPMQPVFSKADLEAMPGTALLPVSLNGLRAFNTRFGVKAAYTVPYIAACREGWAPAPTNEYQQAIWDKVHTIPDKPLTIDFDPAKDK